MNQITNPTTTSSIPIISYNSESRVEEIKQAIQSIGFFYLVDHPLVQLMDQAFEFSKKFFELPNQIKQDLHTVKGESGYVSTNSEKLNGKDIDLKEAYNVRLSKSDDDYGKEFFPNEETNPSVQGFKEFSNKLFLELHNLLLELLRDLQKGLNKPVGDDFTLAHSEMEHSLRYLHYPKLTNTSSTDFNNGCGLHCDYGSLTLLCQDDTGGLKVLNRITNEMMNAPCVNGSIIVNCGDLMQEWTNQECKSVPHQVVLSNYETDRYSIAFFGQPDKEYFIQSVNKTAYQYLLQKFAHTYGN